MIENLTNLSIGRQLKDGCGNRPAIIFDGQEISYNELGDQVMAVMADILPLVHPDECVAIIMPDCPAFVASFFGIIAAGAIATPINPKLDPTTIGDTLVRIHASTAIVHSSLHEPLRETLAKAKCRILEMGSSIKARNLPWDTERMRGAASDAAYCLFSSGTTGVPKAIVHNHLSAVECLRSFEAGVLALSSEDRILAAPKLTFGYGLVGNAIFSALRGAAAILLKEPYRFDLFKAALSAYKPTLVLSQPKVISDFIVADLSMEYFPRSQVWLSAGESLSPSLHERWSKKFQVPIFDVLGATELGHIFIANTDLKSRPGSAGQVLPGFEARIVDANGSIASPGQRGELAARGPGMTKRYLNDEVRSNTLTETGWIRTGDLASRSADGYYTIHGRVDDLIKVGCGEWILPTEFEQIINSDRDVAESAVIGRCNSAGLTEASAIVVLKSRGVNETEITQRLRNAIQTSYPEQPHKRLGAIEYTERVPRTINGKIDRKTLRIVTED